MCFGCCTQCKNALFFFACGTANGSTKQQNFEVDAELDDRNALGKGTEAIEVAIA